jgi:hypothetical protein
MAWKEAGFEMINFIVDLIPFVLEKHRSQRPETRKHRVQQGNV